MNGVCAARAVAALCLGLLGSHAAVAATCAQLQPLLKDAACAQSASGSVVAAGAERAQALLALAEGGRLKFERAFATPAPRYAVIEQDSGLMPDGLRDAIRATGTPVVLPWLSSAAQQAQIEASVRRSVSERMRQAGIEGAAATSAVESAVAQAKAQINPQSAQRRDSTALPHELAHLWLIESFWAQRPKAVTQGYGGPGPDWLDEMAAVLAEPDESKLSRRGLFWSRYAGLGATASARTTSADSLIDLVGYFTSPHPLVAAMRSLGTSDAPAGSRSGTSIRVLGGEAASGFAADGIRFYLQSILVSDFLIEASGDPAILSRIAPEIAKGMSFEQWLAAYGSDHKLPVSTEAFRSQWLQWIERTRPPV
jgi:hypothetical protein